MTHSLTRTDMLFGIWSVSLFCTLLEEQRFNNTANCTDSRMLKGKVAVVSGSAQGLGKSFTHILLENGAQVAMLDVNEVLGQELQVQLNQQYGPDRTQFYKADVSSDQQFTDVFQKILSKFSRIDIFCNNAGIANEENWEKTISINLSGVVRGTYLALDHMKKQNGGNGGVIINISSLAGLGPFPSAPIYTATKYGVVGFTRCLCTSWYILPL
ncbi:hypothetical protein AMELA_G00205700 [Ameiurus melas]|uniref:15-hydroxyprostaglandin dehydrogenase n=1 Tax=Ameiurus melas TaxID=219545 RepID=A0A7J6A5K1_AMEME|nr:hypothetical protein AMELA_G00205700 [Ameiurus melas]